MNRVGIALTLSLLATGAYAQQRSVVQSGNVTPSHIARWISPGVIADGGAAADGLISTIGVTNNGGAGICVASDRQTAAGRNQLCFGATTNGGTKISSYAYGTATNPGLVFDINGSVQGFPAVTLPVTGGNSACFDGTTGLLKDCGTPPPLPGVTSVGTGSGLTGGPITVSGTISIDGAFGSRNRIINPSGAISQRALGSNADVTYAWDRWYVITQTAAVDTSQISNMENGSPYAMRLTQSQASAQRMGMCQQIESANIIDARGSPVTLSMRVRLSTSANIRVAVGEWSGTVDSPIKDIVNDWNSSIYTTGDFFIATTTAIVNTSATAVTANTPASISITGTSSSSLNNMWVCAWTEGTAAQNVTLDVANVQLERASGATPLAYRSIAQEMNDCLRYYEVISSQTDGGSGYGVGQVSNVASALVTLTWKAMKRIKPSLSVSAVSDWAFYNDGINLFLPWQSFSSQSTPWGGHFHVVITSSGFGAPGQAAVMAPNGATLNARIFIDAEL